MFTHSDRSVLPLSRLHGFATHGNVTGSTPPNSLFRRLFPTILCISNDTFKTQKEMALLFKDIRGEFKMFYEDTMVTIYANISFFFIKSLNKKQFCWELVSCSVIPFRRLDFVMLEYPACTPPAALHLLSPGKHTFWQHLMNLGNMKTTSTKRYQNPLWPGSRADVHK